jgi:oxygen-dependent protoporphyrinogen oxidase
LSAQLEGDCRLDTAVQAIDTACPGYELTLNDGSRLVTNAVVLAVPAYIAAQLLEPLAPDAARLLEAIRYVSTGTISLGFRADQINHPLDGFGIVIPRTEERSINAITWSSTKFDRRAPEGYVLLRAFFGGSRTPHMMSTGDDELLAVVRREIAAIMGITTPHLFHRIYRYFDANPQYDVGHLSRVATIEASLPRCIHVTGSPYGGIGIPDCVYHAQVTVDSILNGITTQAA